MIVSSVVEVPELSELSATVTLAPPSTAIFLSSRPLTKPTHFPSGEKNGALAPSAPRMGLASLSSNRRVNSCDCPSLVVYVKTRRRPSG